jgi:hypothetical protein
MKIKLFPTTPDEWTSLLRPWFFLGLGIFVLGFFMDFIPGAEQGWFIFTACLVSIGFLIPRASYRLVAAVFLLFCVLLVAVGHRHGVEHEAWLAQRDPPPVGVRPP